MSTKDSNTTIAAAAAHTLTPTPTALKREDGRVDDSDAGSEHSDSVGDVPLSSVAPSDPLPAAAAAPIVTAPTKPPRNKRRRVEDISKHEIWRCSFVPCTKIYKRTSTISINNHRNSCKFRPIRPQMTQYIGGGPTAFLPTQHHTAAHHQTTTHQHAMPPLNHPYLLNAPLPPPMMTTPIYQNGAYQPGQPTQTPMGPPPHTQQLYQPHQHMPPIQPQPHMLPDTYLPPPPPPPLHPSSLPLEYIDPPPSSVALLPPGGVGGGAAVGGVGVGVGVVVDDKDDQALQLANLNAALLEHVKQNQSAQLHLQHQQKLLEQQQLEILQRQHQQTMHEQRMAYQHQVYMQQHPHQHQHQQQPHQHQQQQLQHQQARQQHLQHQQAQQQQQQQQLHQQHQQLQAQLPPQTPMQVQPSPVTSVGHSPMQYPTSLDPSFTPFASPLHVSHSPLQLSAPSPSMLSYLASPPVGPAMPLLSPLGPQASPPATLNNNAMTIPTQTATTPTATLQPTSTPHAIAATTTTTTASTSTAPMMATSGIASGAAATSTNIGATAPNANTASLNAINTISPIVSTPLVPLAASPSLRDHGNVLSSPLTALASPGSFLASHLLATPPQLSVSASLPILPPPAAANEPNSANSSPPSMTTTPVSVTPTTGCGSTSAPTPIQSQQQSTLHQRSMSMGRPHLINGGLTSPNLSSSLQYIPLSSPPTPLSGSIHNNGILSPLSGSYSTPSPHGWGAWKVINGKNSPVGGGSGSGSGLSISTGNSPQTAPGSSTSSHSSISGFLSPAMQFGSLPSPTASASNTFLSPKQHMLSLPYTTPPQSTHELWLDHMRNRMESLRAGDASSLAKLHPPQSVPSQSLTVSADSPSHDVKDPSLTNGALPPLPGWSGPVEGLPSAALYASAAKLQHAALHSTHLPLHPTPSTVMHRLSTAQQAAASLHHAQSHGLTSPLYGPIALETRRPSLTAALTPQSHSASLTPPQSMAHVSPASVIAVPQPSHVSPAPPPHQTPSPPADPIQPTLVSTPAPAPAPHTTSPATQPPQPVPVPVPSATTAPTMTAAATATVKSS